MFFQSQNPKFFILLTTFQVFIMKKKQAQEKKSETLFYLLSIVKLGTGEAGARRIQIFVHADLVVLQEKNKIRVLVQSPVKGELLGL